MITPQEHLEAIKKACQAANPNATSNIICCRRGSGIAGQAFTSFQCPYCQETFSWHNTSTPSICEDCAKKFMQCQWCRVVLEREMGLADVLMAIGDIGLASMNILKEKDYHSVSFIWDLDLPIEKHKHFVWDLTKDLYGQSPETLSFLYSLIQK